MAKRLLFNRVKNALMKQSNLFNVTGVDTVSAKEILALAKRDPGIIPDIVSNDHMYRAAFGLNNTRASSQYNLIRAIDTGYLVSPSSALTPKGRPPWIGSGYQSQPDGLGARIYITPEWTKPSINNGIVTFKGDAYTSNTKEFLSTGRIAKPQYIPRAYHNFISWSSGGTKNGSSNLSDEYHKLLSMNYDKAYANAMYARNNTAQPYLDKFANLIQETLGPRTYHSGPNYIRGAWYHFVIGGPDAKSIPLRSKTDLNPAHDYGFLRTALDDIANGKPVSMKIFQPASRDYRAIVLSPEQKKIADLLSRGVTPSLRDFWTRYGDDHYLYPGYQVSTSFTERARELRDSLNSATRALPPGPHNDPGLYEKLKRDSFHQAVESLNQHEIAMRNLTVLRGIPKGVYAGDNLAQRTMQGDLGYLGRGYDDPVGVPFVLDAEKGLPGSFYDWLGKHRYLENKVYGRMPISREAISGVGIERDLKPGIETASAIEGVDKIKRTLDAKKIPWLEYGPGTGATEKDVQEALAPTIHMAAKGGNTKSTRAASRGGDTNIPTAPMESSGGPRIVINPSTFHNEKDAMCVAWNEALRIVMEETGFDPVSEPTDAQREFFADTAYADDELQLRRTILARICTFDTSVKDPTDEQIQEAIEFVSSVMEGGFPRNEWEQSCLKKILDILSSVPIAPNDGSPRTPVEPPQEADPGATASELGGQTQKEEERDLTAGGAILTDLKYDAQGPAMGPQKDSEVPLDSEKQDNRNLTAGGAILADPKYDVQGPAVRKEDELQ